MLKDAKIYENIYQTFEKSEEKYNYVTKANDNYLTYTICLKKDALIDENFEYKSIFNSGLNINKIEIVILNDNIQNILVYNQKDEIYLSIEYDSLTINSEIDENMFNI